VSGEWKTHLFSGIMNLSESLVDYSMKILRELVQDPHHALKEYIHVHLRQVTESEFILKHKSRDLKHQEVTVILKICAMQMFRLASFTSCGWFFSDIDRPEPRIVIGNAKKALSLLAEIGHVNKAMELEEKFVAELQNAKSNRTAITGKDLYLEYVPLLAA
jgi:hypothetical protein